MECTRCGAAIADTAALCDACGAPVAGARAADPPASPPASPAALAGPLTRAARTLQRILTFDPTVYAELRADASATAPSLTIAALALFAFGLGGFIWAQIEVEGRFRWEGLFWKTALLGPLIAFALWLAWVLLAVAILGRGYGVSLRIEEVLRVAGAASAPLAVGFFMVLPGISFGVALLAVVAWAVASTVALHAAFEIPLQRAALANLAGFALWAVTMPLVVSDNDPLGPGILLFESIKDLISR